MWTVTFCGVILVTLVSGDINKASFKGCVSTSFVQQYAFYYRINQPLQINESIAVCNHRLTKYIGLEVDKRYKIYPGYNFVYCGNDLLEVSPKLNESQCHPCYGNEELLCGEDKVMAVYLLRESTPLTILMATHTGVERLTNFTSTVLVSYSWTYGFNSVDYIYSQDVIISVIDKHLLRSYFQTLYMQFSHAYSVVATSNETRSLAVDFIQNVAYWGYDLYKTNLKSNTTERMLTTPSYIPKHISVDPYNRLLVFFLELPSSTIHFYQLNTNKYYNVSLAHLHVHKITAVTMDIHEKLLYAILTLKGDSETYLVSLDYELSRMEVMFGSSHLRNATALDVFQGEAVWLSRDGRYYMINTCKLFAGCRLGLIKNYYSSTVINDITIYHPEKQTPGEKWLCANLTCQYGCKAVSLFTARCLCPPGKEINLDDNTCYEITTSPTPTNTSSKYGYFTNSDIITPSNTESDVPINNQDQNISFKEAFIIMFIAIILLTQILLFVLICKRNERHTEASNALEQRQLNELCNDYEIPFPK